MTTLLYLELRQFINLLKLATKSPRRLIPLVILGFWIYLFAAGTIFGNPHHMTDVHIGPIDRYWPEVFMALAATGIYYINKSFSESIIIFSLSDIDFLFAIPLSHRLIMGLKLLKVYAKAGLMVLFITTVFAANIGILTTAYDVLQLLWVSVAVIVYSTVIVNTCTLINLLASFRPGGKWWVHLAVKGTVIAIFVFISSLAIMNYIHTRMVIPSLLHTFSHPVLTALFLPVKWTTDLVIHPVGSSNHCAAFELLGMIMVAVVSFVLVIIRKENPYEPSLTISKRAAALKAAFRSGGFGKAQMERMKSSKIHIEIGISPFGRGAVAIFWKNITVLLRTSGRTLIAIPVLIAIGLFITRFAFSDRIDAHGIAIAVIVGMSYMVFLTSGFMLQSLRNDMRQTNTLKTIPISAWKIILAQTAPGTIVMTLLGWITFSLVAVIYGLEPQSPLILSALILPFVVNAALCSQVAVAIIYPNWDDVSQRYIGGLLSMFANMLTIIPAIAVAVAFIWYNLQIVIGVLAINSMEIGLSIAGIALGSYAYKRYDPTNE